jgi:hypothetical protein
MPIQIKASHRKKTVAGQQNDFDKRNLENAREILSNPEQHGGPEAFPAMWARLVIARIAGGAA